MSAVVILLFCGGGGTVLDSRLLEWEEDVRQLTSSKSECWALPPAHAAERLRNRGWHGGGESVGGEGAWN